MRPKRCRPSWSFVRLRATVCVAGLLMACSDGPRSSTVAATPTLIVFAENGGWSWFTDQRVVVDGDHVLIGTAAGTTRGGTDRGDIDLTIYDLTSHASTKVELHDQLQGDDHDAPSILRLADGRYLAMYTKHNTDPFVRWRVSTEPGDPARWDPEQTFEPVDLEGGAVTYTNTFKLSAEGDRVYNFFRGSHNNPHVMTSSRPDLSDFTQTGRLFTWDLTPATGADSAKITGIFPYTSPYVRYASNGVDTIHFITTEDHPRAYDNSIYHGFIRGGAVHDSFGRVVDPSLFDGEARSPVDYTLVFRGDADHVAWTTDIELAADGNPFIAFSVQRGGAAVAREQGQGGLDCRYYYGRFDGVAWHVHELAYAGARLYAGEDDYTGLVALNPADPDTLYIATNADPKEGTPLVSAADGRRHYEIYRGRTADMGASWAWSPVTANSTTDNLRPTIPASSGHTLLLWLRGTYTTMNDYDQDVVGLVDPKEGVTF